MDRLQAELQRLYFPAGIEGLFDADGRVRALVLEVAASTAWQEVSRLWQGVQADLDLPAPAIAVNGTDAWQLWFSLAQPVPLQRATGFLAALRARYLRGLPEERIRLQASQALPPAELEPDRWAAFVAPDLAPLFAGEPWLDQPPGRDAQAEVLARVASAKPEAFERACARLEPVAVPEPAEVGTPVTVPAATHAPTDPRTFLLSVMQDASVDLHLRIEAARALLAFPER
jgi:hypothetical protein